MIWKDEILAQTQNLANEFFLHTTFNHNRIIHIIFSYFFHLILLFILLIIFLIGKKRTCIKSTLK